MAPAPTTTLDATQRLMDNKKLSREAWIFEDGMQTFHDKPTRDFPYALHSTHPDQVQYRKCYDNFFNHVRHVNAWLRPDQAKCTWTAIPAHIKRAMYEAQVRFGLRWGVEEFVHKIVYVHLLFRLC